MYIHGPCLVVVFARYPLHRDWSKCLKSIQVSHSSIYVKYNLRFDYLQDVVGVLGYEFHMFLSWTWLTWASVYHHFDSSSLFQMLARVPL